MKTAIIKSHSVFTLFFLFLTVASAGAKTIYVDANGTGDYPTIQAAIDAASDNDEIVLADGTYEGLGNWDIKVTKIVTIRSQNGPENCIIDCNEVGKEHFGLRIQRRNITIEGISIKNAIGKRGAAIICENRGFLLSNCNISDNRARGEGAAFALLSNQSAQIYNCIMKNNTAGYRGGAIFFNSMSSAKIVNCTIANNSATTDGGGICCLSNSIDIRNSSIIKNSVSSPQFAQGGGVYFRKDSESGSVNISNCTISENQADGGNYSSFGGGLCCILGCSTGNIPVTITKCRFENNTALGNECFGGGVCIEWGCGDHEQFGMIFSDCQFLNNKAGILSNPVAVLKGGAIYSEENNLILYKCLLQNNTADVGPAAFFDNSKAVIVNCLISGNIQRYYKNGCIVFDKHQYSQSMILRSTITGNILYAIESANKSYPLIIHNSIIYGNNHPYENHIPQIRGYADVSYSCLQNGWPGVGNIDTDPCFVDPGYWDPNGTPNNWEDDFWVEGDYRLRPESLCCDAGCYPQYLLDNTDLNDLPRIIGPAIDMGAYEFQIPPCLKAKLFMIPKALNPNSRRRMVSALLSMPPDVFTDDIDRQESLIFYPGSVESRRQFVFELNRKNQIQTYVLGIFDIKELCRALCPDRHEVEVVGRLKDGRCFSGSDTIKVVPKKWK